VPAAAKTPLLAIGAKPEIQALLAANAGPIGVLARVTEIVPSDGVPPSAAQIVVGEVTYAIPLAGVVDFSAEEARLEKEIARLRDEIGRIDKKLANAKFVARAPEEVVEAEREKRAAYAADGERLMAALKRVKQAA
jgi:valyl-tRNA synthetase